MPDKILVLDLWAKVLLVSQIEGLFKMYYLKKEVASEVYFLHVHKHQSFPQVDTINLGVRSLTYSKCPK